MATTWDNPIGPSTRIMAHDVDEVVVAINSNRASAVPPLAPFPWTDPNITGGMRIMAYHFTQMRDAIQELWTRKGMGSLPPWTSASKVNGGPGSGRRMYASDLTDLRAWLNQYELDPPVKPFKGIHMSIYQFRDVDRKALDMASPAFGLIVALSDDLDLQMQNVADLYPGESPTMSSVLNWFADTQGTEILVRLYPTPGPVDPPFGWDLPYEKKDVGAVVDKIEAIRAHGANFKRIVVGNEPNIEWPGVERPGWNTTYYYYHDEYGNGVSWKTQWYQGKWKAINAYHAEILNEVKRRGLDAELWFPAMAQAAGGEGVETYCDNGSVGERYLNNPDDTARYDDWGAGSRGYDHLQSSLLGRSGYTDGYGRLTWHNYFFSWHASEDCVSLRFPAWLQDALYGSKTLHSRITECGWYPGVPNQPGGEPRHRDSAAGRYKQYACNDPAMPNFASVMGPDGGPSDPDEGYYYDDLFWFIKHARSGAPPAEGVAVWLLSAGLYYESFKAHVGIPRTEELPQNPNNPALWTYWEWNWFQQYRQWSDYPMGF